MKNFRIVLSLSAICLISQFAAQAQNIFSGERVMVVGQFNGYLTTPYGTDYRTTTYRRVTTAAGTPTDGRGQWATTINVQNAGGDVTPINMPGGGGNGFLFISGPSADRFQNKWDFSGIGQAGLDAINSISAFNSGNDMGLNMLNPGFYTLVFNDAGYTQTNARFYAGYTTNAPVSVTRSSEIKTAAKVTVNITTNTTPSSQEKIYVRYTTGTDFSGAGTSTTVQASGSGTSYTANFSINGTSNYRYFIFTSTLTLAQLSLTDSFFSPTATEADKNLSVLRYDDNAGANFTVLAPLAASLGVSGRVTNSMGRGISRAKIIITNQQGESRIIAANQLGFYKVNELNAGETYIFEVKSKSYSFNPQVLTLNENLDNLNFTAQ